MTYEVINPDTNASFFFSSEEAWERAIDWYNASSKAEIIAWCDDHGISRIHENRTTLVEDWADVAMAAWAAAHDA